MINGIATGKIIGTGASKHTGLRQIALEVRDWQKDVGEVKRYWLLEMSEDTFKRQEKIVADGKYIGAAYFNLQVGTMTIDGKSTDAIVASVSKLFIL